MVNVKTRIGGTALFEQVGDVGLDPFEGFAWQGTAFDREHAVVGDGGLLGAAGTRMRAGCQGRGTGVAAAELFVEMVEGDEVVAAARMASAPRWGREPWAATPVTVISGQTNPRWAVPSCRFGRLGYHCGVGCWPGSAGGGLLDAQAGELLVGDGGDDDLAVRCQRGRRPAGDEGGGEAGLHVVRTAGVEPVAVDAGRECVLVPASPTVSRWAHRAVGGRLCCVPPRRMTLAGRACPRLPACEVRRLRPSRRRRLRCPPRRPARVEAGVDELMRRRASRRSRTVRSLAVMAGLPGHDGSGRHVGTHGRGHRGRPSVLSRTTAAAWSRSRAARRRGSVRAGPGRRPGWPRRSGPTRHRADRGRRRRGALRRRSRPRLRRILRAAPARQSWKWCRSSGRPSPSPRSTPSRVGLRSGSPARMRRCRVRPRAALGCGGVWASVVPHDRLSE